MKSGPFRIEIAAVLAAIFVAAPALADRATPFEQRGYKTCVADLKRDFHPTADLWQAPRYYIAQQGDEATYFINSHAWQDDDRVAMRTRCDTAGWGGVLDARETEIGETWTRAKGGHITIFEVSER